MSFEYVPSKACWFRAWGWSRLVQVVCVNTTFEYLSSSRLRLIAFVEYATGSVFTAVVGYVTGFARTTFSEYVHQGLPVETPKGLADCKHSCF